MEIVQLFLKNQAWTTLYSIFRKAGVFCAVASQPADTVVSKLNQEPGSSAWQVARQLGRRGRWRGLSARIVMIGTIAALQWLIYDACKVALRLPRPPPPEMPASLRKTN